MKKIKVKDLALKYGVTSQEILKELQGEGISLSAPSNLIPADMIDLVEGYLDDFYHPSKKTATVASASESAEPAAPVPSGLPEVHIKTPIVVKSLAEAVGKKPNIVISDLMGIGVLAAINQTVEPEVAAKLCVKYGLELVVDRREKEVHAHVVEESKDDFVDNPSDLHPRPPVVTFLGHVDHGKTSLQDKVRNTRVVDREAGGITQHIGASSINYHGKKITFIDTPGHEAFTQMRARGASTTDIAVLVVAADDGFMPQTVEALNQARAANVPIIVAINKMDLPDANPDRVLLHMQQNNLLSEEWGGNVGVVKVSALTGMGVSDLLDRILLEAEMLEIKGNPKRPGEGVVIEAQIEHGLGATANVLVKNGTLHLGDPILCGACYGKVKTLIDEHGKRIKSAGPSMPVKIVGLSGIPEAGSKLKVCKSEKDARQLAETNADERRELHLNKTVTPAGAVVSLEDLFSQMSSSLQNTLRVLIKADVKGSAEAIVDSLAKLPSEKIKADVVMSGVGSITENDVSLAAASGAILIGFHVRVNPGVNALAKKEKVEIRLYSIIYELVEDIIEALQGRLAPDKREKELGTATILQIISLSKGAKVCGSMVEKGVVRVGAKARVFRKGELIFNGEVKSLRRFHDDVKEVKVGLECGIKLDNFADFEENDTIQIYEVEFSKATLH